jgi:hypothetical protein
MARHGCALLTVLIASKLAALQAHAQAAPKSGFSLELDSGLEYNSVVSLNELDLSNNEGDTALLVDATAGYNRELTDSLELDLGYTYSVLDYRDIDSVDQDSHIFSADLVQSVGGAKVGLSGFYVSSDLDDQDFMELGRVSPHISGFIADGWFLRGGVVHSTKTNDINPGRDATAVISEIDAYHFPAGKPWFVHVGYKYRDEDADASRFDYTGNTLKVRYVYRLPLFEKKSRLELAHQYIDRNYSALTPSIGEERLDRRNRSSIELQVELSPSVDVRMYYNYSDWESNLDSVDFSRNVAGVRVTYRWEP